MKFNLIAILSLSMLAGVSCTNPASQATSKIKTTGPEDSKRVLRFSDNFNGNYAPPDNFDLTRWTKLWGNSRAGDGCAVMEGFRPLPSDPGPGQMIFSGFATAVKHFNPGLTGANGVEVALLDYTHENNYPPEMDSQILRNHIMGWGITIGNWQGQVGMQNDYLKDRGVQIHFDWLGPDGYFFSLVRGVVPEDFDKYPNDGIFLDSAVAHGVITQEHLDSLDVTPWSIEKTRALAKQGAFVSYPCFVAACRSYPADKINPLGRRYGLFLSDNGNTVYWTMDGKVMDSFDITGYFASNPGVVDDGAYVIIGAAGVYQQNNWKIDDVKIYSGP